MNIKCHSLLESNKNITFIHTCLSAYAIILLMATKPKRPRDANQLAKSIVDLTTGDAEEEKLTDEGKDPAAARRYVICCT